MHDRRVVIEFASIMVVMTVLGILARDVMPEVHQLLRFAVVLAITVALWLVARVVLRRYEQP